MSTVLCGVNPIRIERVAALLTQSRPALSSTAKSYGTISTDKARRVYEHVVFEAHYKEGRSDKSNDENSKLINLHQCFAYKYRILYYPLAESLCKWIRVNLSVLLYSVLLFSVNNGNISIHIFEGLSL